MPTPDKTYPTQHIGGTILVVMMDVDPAHEDEFNRWYNERALTGALGDSGLRRAPAASELKEGEGVLRYLCIWELKDGSPLRSEAYKAQQRRPSELRAVSILTLPSGCAASISRFTRPSKLLKTIAVFIQSDMTMVRQALGTHFPAAI